jgi:uncharacterized protein (TIGR00369 family)
MADPNHPFWKAARGELAPPPSVALLGWRIIEAELGSGRVRAQFEARPEFANPTGAIHGGFLAAMLDTLLADACATTLDAGEFAPTVELKVNFIAPAAVGLIYGDSQVVHRGRSIVFLSGELRNPDRNLIATATGTARLTRPKAWAAE